MYLCPNRVEFTGQMPSFNECGLRPVSLVGPRENPVVVAPILAASAELAPRVDVGGQAPLEARGVGAEASTPLEAPEVPSPGAHDSCPGVTAEGATQSAAPKATASEASAGHHEAVPEGSPQPSTPEAVS